MCKANTTITPTMVSQANQQEDDRWSSSPQWICVDGSIADTPPPINCRIRKTAGGGVSWNRTTVQDKPSRQEKKCHTTTRRRVTFDANVTVRCVKSLNDYSDRRLSVTYYSREEYKRIWEQRKNEAKILSSMGNIPLEDSEICPRGIEYEAYIEVKQTKLSTRLNARISLFDEQDYQQNTGCYDEKYLAEAYSKYTKGAMDAAILIAMQDAREALRHDPSSFMNVEE